MKGIARAWIIFSLTALAFSLAFAFFARRAGAQDVTPPPPSTDEAIAAALQSAVQANEQHVLGFLINDVEINHIAYSKDGRTALLWLSQRDPATGEILGREPALAIARNPQGVIAKSTDWQIDFEFGRDFALNLSTLPAELVTEDVRQRFSAIQGAVSQAAVTHTGYKLPWSTALRIKLTGSVGHFLDYNSCSETYCRYAYDFWNPDPGNRMFPLLASKGGVVQAYRESCQNGATDCTNYLVLRDDSTTPTTYQLYYHLAYDSVPDDYTPGTYIQQGQYVGDVDDTGYSSDHHLHFHVYETRSNSAYSWGISVRIIFSDVSVNGGEPRTCAETINHSGYGTECSAGPDGKKLTADDNYYISGNTGAFPPSGSLSTPAPWSTLTERVMTVSGPASDNLGIARVQVLVNYDGTWRSIADANHTNGVYSAAVDVCTAGIPDGPFALATRIWDKEGNWVAQYTGTRQVFKNVPCGSGAPSVPLCVPSANEVALYSEPFYAGSCKKFTAGKYTTSMLTPVGDNAAQSIQVGDNVRAVLFERNDDLNLNRAQGRVETFTAADANLGDNRLGARQASALWVFNSTDIANPSLIEPFLTYPGNRVDSDSNADLAPNPPNPTSTDSLVLAWTGGRGATFCTGSLVRNGATVKTMSAQKAQTWSVGSLPAGTYTWTITACNGLTSCSGATTNSSSLTFTVDPASLPTTGAVNTPTAVYEFQSGASDWTGTGLWRWGDANRFGTTTKAWIFNNGTSIADATYRAGDLTSPPITIAAAGNYYLYYKFFSGVEGPVYDAQTFAGAFWDQRRIQVSVNGGDFTDVSGGQLIDDTQNSASYWPETALALGNFSAGQVVRVRFHFDTVDGTNNNLYGWAVDDISITNVPFDPGCKDNNDTPATASPLTLGTPVNNRICPQGDVDVFSFAGAAGTPLLIDLDAKSLNSANPLDSVVSLLDDSGRDVLALNDDEDINNLNEARYRDSFIETVLPKAGTYYVRVKAWNYPGGGDVNHTYRLTVAQNATIPRPTISLIQPADPTRLPVVPFIVEVNAADPDGTGIKQVDFYWHANSWDNTTTWVKFASDVNGSDGWWSIFNPSGDTTGSAFYILATNNSGGTSGLLVRDLAPDLSTPYSTLNPLPATTNSTAVLLTWSANDLQNDIERFDVQYRFNAGAWTDWSVKPAGSAVSAWFVGQPGTYQFRLRAVDSKGNQEAYPSGAEASTTLNGVCSNDNSEPGNNTSSGAISLLAGQTHEFVFCQSDTDWVSFQAQQGVEYLIFIHSVSGGAAARVNLYNPAGSLVLQGQASAPGAPLVWRWSAPANGTYKIEIRPLDPTIYGSDVRYAIYAGPGKWIFMPSISR
jgi:hypothetical protein